MNDRILTIKKHVMAYSDKITGDIQKDAENITMLTVANKHLRQNVDEIYACYKEVSWEAVAESLPEADTFFGKITLILDDCVNQYLTDYNAKIIEYIEDLRNKRSKVDIENGMEGMLMDAAMDDDQVIDPAAYLDKYKKMAETEIPHLPKKSAGSFFDESPI